MKAFERTLMIAEKEYALAMNEIAHASAIIESSLELNMQRAELKVLQESGNEMDLLYLYEAAGQDAQNNANQQGFFSKMATAVKNFITKVWNGIQKIFTGKNTEAYDKLMKAQGKIKLSIPDPTEILNNVESGLSAINGKTAGIGLAAAASIGGIIAAIKNFKNRENKEENFIDGAKAKGLLGIIERIKGHIDSIFKKGETSANEEVTYKDDAGAEQKTDTKGILGKICDAVKDATGWVAGKITAGLSAIGIHAGADKPDPSNNNLSNTTATQDGNAGNIKDVTKAKTPDEAREKWAEQMAGESVEAKLTRLSAMLEGL